MKNKICYLITLMCILYSSAKSQNNDKLNSLIDMRRYSEIVAAVGQKQPEDFSTINILGKAYEGLLQYKDAYKCYEKCYQIDSTNIDVLYSLARTAVSIGHAKDAEKYYNMILQSDSTDFYANYQMARLYGQLERNEDALKKLQCLSDKYLNNPNLLKSIGDCYSRMDSIPQSAALYTSAFNLNKENTTVAALAINATMNSGSTNEASAICDTALAYNPESKQLRQKRAMIYYAQKRYTKSDSLYTKLIAEGDSSYMTLKYCGCARYQAEKWYDAIEPLELTYLRDSTAYDVCIYLGTALGLTYDPNLGLSYLNRAQELMKPDSLWTGILIQSLGMIYNKTGRCMECARLNYGLWKKNPKAVSYLRSIAGCFNTKYSDDKNISDEMRQRKRYMNFLVASEMLKHTNEAIYLNIWRSYLEKMRDEMFFSGAKSMPMIAPDNKKSNLTMEEVKRLLDKFPK